MMNQKNDLKEICKLYFNLFSKKDIDGLSKLFSNDVTLRDWDILAIGKDEVIAANKNIFDNLDRINVKLLSQSLVHNDRVFNQILIEIDNKETLRVVDIISFDNNGLIKKVEAYKG